MSLAVTQLIGFGGRRALVCTLQSASGLTKIGNMTNWGGLAAAFDGTTSQSATAGARSTGNPQFIGVDWGSGVTKTVCRYIVYGPNNNTFTIGNGGTPNLELYGSNSSPANSTDGTQLAAAAMINSSLDEVVDKSTGITETTAYRYHWIRCTGADLGIAEIIFYARA